VGRKAVVVRTSAMMEEQEQLNDFIGKRSSQTEKDVEVQRARKKRIESTLGKETCEESKGNGTRCEVRLNRDV
jgi:hypothetical protein